jgi:hypothetical protein
MMWRSSSREMNKKHPHLAFASERGGGGDVAVVVE